MLLLLFVAVATLAVPVFRGRLLRLAEVRFRGTWLLALALGTQLWVLAIVPGPRTPAREAAYVATYVLAIGFLFLNRRLPGFWLVGMGAVMNLAAIAANGGVMPAAEHALARANLPLEVPRFFTNSIPVDHPRLAFLGDIFAVPASWPFSNVFSAGDVCIALGAALAIHRISGSHLLPSGAGQFVGLLRGRSYRRLWAAQGISNLGDWVYALTVAATLSDRVGGPQLATSLSILLIAQVAPAAVFGVLFAGPLVDRRSRRGLMIGADALRAVAVGSLLVSPEPSPGHFYAVAVALGLFGAAFQPSLMASIPNVVPGDRVVAANAMVAATYHLAVMAGPALGAFLVGSLGPRPVFGLNAASFALSAALIVGARLPRPTRPDVERTSPLRDLREGMRYILATPLVRGVLVVTGIVMLAAATKAPLEPLFVRDVLAPHGDFADRARVLGMITTAWGLGMLLGSVGAPALARRWHRERLLPASIAVVGLAILAVARTTDFQTVLLAWLVAGAANSVGNVSYESLLQERTPDAFRGRVFAASEAVLDGSYLAGAFLAGMLGVWLRASGAFLVSGAILLFAAILARAVLPAPRRPRPVPAPAQGAAVPGR
ncbi:MAG TPA: MFS transporter [Actinomycetota bacterium]|nr:MFS transporter [Actinomycetota bacterium]